MTQQTHLRPGAPCWVDTWQPDPRAARAFYGPLLGWTFDEAGAMPAGLAGEYVTARVAGRLVAGIGQAPPDTPALWSTHVLVDDVDGTLARGVQAGGAPLAGPVEAGPDGRLAVLADATGVPFCLWQAGRRTGAELVGAPGAYAMSALHTTDLERARAFYGALFGWELEPVPGAPSSRWVLAGRVVAVATPTDGVAVPAHWAVSFAVRDADATAEHALALGGTLLVGPVDTPAGRSVVVADPQGGVVALTAPAG